MAKYLDATGLGTLWSTAKSTFLSLGGGVLTGRITISSGNDAKFTLNNTDDENYYQQIQFCQKGEEYGRLGTYGDTDIRWNSNIILHAGNYSTYTVTKSGTGATGTWGISISGDANTLDSYHETSFYRDRGALYQGHDYDANTFKTPGFWLQRSSAYGNVGTGAEHANFPNKENGNFVSLVGVQLWTPPWGGSMCWRHCWGSETQNNNNGWSDWGVLIDSLNYTDYTVTKAGTGASGTWGINITGSAGSVDWSNVGNKPGTFTPSSHTHSNYLSFTNDTNYVAARFHDQTLAQKAAATYIEFWQGGENGGWFNLMAGSFKTSGGNANQFVKGDGSLDSNTYSATSHNHDGTYLKLVGGTISNGDSWATVGFSRTSYGSGTVGGIDSSGLQFSHTDTSSNTIQMYLKYGVGLKVGGDLVWTAGNDGSGSGLDADKLDGKESTDFVQYKYVWEDQTTDNEGWARTNAINNPQSIIYNSQGYERVYLSMLNTGKSNGVILKLNHNGPTAHLMGRLNNNWTDWKQLAFTDSNVASANYATNSGQLGGYPLSSFMVFFVESDYVNASFTNYDISAKAHQKYIEFWDGGGREDTGWYNFRLGELYATDDVKVNGNSVIHTGNIGSQSVNYSTTSNIANHLKYTLLGTSDDLNDISNGLFYHQNYDRPANCASYNCAIIQIEGRRGYDYHQFELSANESCVFYRRGTSAKASWGNWRKFAFVDQIPTNTNQLTNGAGFITSSGSCSNSDTVDSYHLEDILKKISGRNLIKRKPSQAGRTTLEGNKIKATPKTNQGDTYYYIYPINDLPAGKYVFSFTASGFAEGDYWNWAWQNQSSQGVVKAVNGRNHMIVNHPSLTTAGTAILIDDYGSSTAANSDTVYFYDFALYPYDSAEWTAAPEEIIIDGIASTSSKNLSITTESGTEKYITNLYATEVPILSNNDIDSIIV